jgi:hypothetical protein
VHLDVANSTYAYLRRAAGTGEDGARDLLVVFNLSERTRSIALPEFAASRQHDVLLGTDDTIEVDATQDLAIHLPLLSGAMIAVGSSRT